MFRVYVLWFGVYGLGFEVLLGSPPPLTPVVSSMAAPLSLDHTNTVLAHMPTDSLTHPPTHSLTHSLTH